jgi:hypothetical protein
MSEPRAVTAQIVTLTPATAQFCWVLSSITLRHSDAAAFIMRAHGPGAGVGPGRLTDPEGPGWLRMNKRNDDSVAKFALNFGLSENYSSVAAP